MNKCFYSFWKWVCIIACFLPPIVLLLAAIVAESLCQIVDLDFHTRAFDFMQFLDILKAFVPYVLLTPILGVWLIKKL